MASKNLAVGLFVLAAFALFTTGLFLIGNRQEVFARHTEFYTEFANLSGLTKGSKVQVGGMDAGEIVGIAIPGTPASRFKVRFRIDEKLQGLIRTNSVATVGTEGVVGETFLSISPGSANAGPALVDAVLPSTEPIQIADLLDQVKGTIADVDGTVKNANGLLTSVGGNLNETLAGAKMALGNVNDVVVGLKQGRGAAGMLLRDDALAEQVRDAVGNIQQTAANLNHSSTQVNTIVADVQSRGFPAKIDGTLEHIRDTVSNLDTASQQIRQTVTDFAAPDGQGVSAGTNLQEALSNANEATSNLAQDTEAIKHNFFFRPFFRRRGYYNLVHLPPDQYRKDRLVVSSADLRSWFSVGQLFQRDSHGVEQLTTEGQLQLEKRLAEYGDSIVDSPLIVEGYSEDEPIDRLAISRRRSMLVRNFLVKHFDLDPANIGSVALLERPPAGLDHPSWSGISIVVLKGQR